MKASNFSIWHNRVRIVDYQVTAKKIANVSHEEQDMVPPSDQQEAYPVTFSNDEQPVFSARLSVLFHILCC